MAALQVPGRWEDVSPQWVTAVLASRFPGAEVADVTLLWTSDGTTPTEGFQPHDVSGELAARYAAAFVELDTLDALTVLEAVPETVLERKDS
jgi:hypothetical protein